MPGDFGVQDRPDNAVRSEIIQRLVTSLAIALDNLGIRMDELGRHQEALAASREASNCGGRSHAYPLSQRGFQHNVLGRVGLRMWRHPRFFLQVVVGRPSRSFHCFCYSGLGKWLFFRLVHGGRNEYNRM